MMNDSIARASECLTETADIVKSLRNEMAVLRDNSLTHQEQIAYLEGLIWAEERGLR